MKPIAEALTIAALAINSVSTFSSAATKSQIDCDVRRNQVKPGTHDTFDQFTVYVFATPDQKKGHLKIFALPPSRPLKEETLVYENRFPLKNFLGGMQYEDKFEIVRKQHQLPEGVRKILYRCEFTTENPKGSAKVLSMDQEAGLPFNAQKLTTEAAIDIPAGYSDAYDQRTGDRWIMFATNRSDGSVLDGEKGVSRYDHNVFPSGFRNSLPLLSFGFSKVRVLSSKQSASASVSIDEFKQRVEEIRDIGDSFNPAHFSKLRHLVVYIHGYNNKQWHALYGAAKIKRQLETVMALRPENERGPVETLAFTWPSEGRTINYPSDELTSKASVDALKNLLVTLTVVPGNFRIHIVVHSMGNRIVLNALYELRSLLKGAGNGGRIDNVIFAAPDVDAYRFALQTIAVREKVKRLTLYHSVKDKPLMISGRIPHLFPEPAIQLWESEKDRASFWVKQELPPNLASFGRAGHARLRFLGLQSIDADKVNSKLIHGNEWEHTYFLEADRVIQDIASTVINDLDAQARPDLRPLTPGKTAWEFR